MPKLYITYNSKLNQKEYYSYRDTTKYITLNPEEIEAYFQNLNSHKIRSARSVNDNLLEVQMENGEIVVIDNLKVFKGEENDLRTFIANIKDSLESSNISSYKKRLPESYTPKVKRSNNKDRYIIEDNSLAANLILSSNYQKLSMDLRDIEMYNNETSRGR